MITGITAIAAVAGAVGLLTGTVDLGADAVSRLPWHSGPLAGLALAVVVALPMTVATVLTVHDDYRQGPAAMLAGVLLVGWIGAEVAVVREANWLQAVFVAVGVTVVLIGRQRVTARHRTKGRTS